VLIIKVSWLQGAIVRHWRWNYWKGKVTVLDNSHRFDKAIKVTIDDITSLCVAN